MLKWSVFREAARNIKCASSVNVKVSSTFNITLP